MAEFADKKVKFENNKLVKNKGKVKMWQKNIRNLKYETFPFDIKSIIYFCNLLFALTKIRLKIFLQHQKYLWEIVEWFG